MGNVIENLVDLETLSEECNEEVCTKESQPHVCCCRNKRVDLDEVRDELRSKKCD
jgi:hypothetical protein